MYYLLFLTCCMLTFFGCDHTFQPLKENNKYYFSIYGYLDVSADTQWVRVAPVRQQLNLPSVAPEVKVTLEHVESGETVVMKDSLFGGGSGFGYINYYTLMEIDPRQTYRVKAERPDGKSSRVTLTTPGEFPTPLFYRDLTSTSERHYYQIIMRGADNIVDVQTWWFVRIASEGEVTVKKFKFTYADRLQWVEAYGGTYIVEFVYEDEEEAIMDSPLVRTSPHAEVEVLHRQAYVANAGPEWDAEMRSLDDLFYAQMDVVSNVENGLGYVVGVYSKVIPYETCKDSSGWITECEEEEPYW